MGFAANPYLIYVVVSRVIENFILVSHVDIFMHKSKGRLMFDLLYSDYFEKIKRNGKRKIKKNQNLYLKIERMYY